MADQQQDNRPRQQQEGGQQPEQNPELFRVRGSWLLNWPPPPDELVIQEKVVSLVHNEFGAAHVETMPVADIGHVTYMSIPLSASLKIIGKNPSHVLQISGIPTDLAMQAKELLDGLILEKSGELDVPEGLHPDSHRELLQKEGQTPFPEVPSQDIPHGKV